MLQTSTMPALPLDGVQGLSIAAADLNGDGRPDVIAGLATQVVWYRNTGFSFSARRFIGTGDDVRSVFAADLNNDGAIDVLSASYVEDTIAWYRNNGTGGFPFGRIVISNTSNAASSVFGADLNGDGAIDVLSASFLDDTIAWYRNNGTGGFPSGKIVISNTADGAISAVAADINDDGAMDVLTASSLDGTIAWYRNNGTGGFLGGKVTISATATSARSVYAGDLDGDGLTDALAAYSDIVAWYRNDGPGSFSSGPIVIGRAVSGATSVLLADMNKDGAMDVLAGTYTENSIFFFRNAGSGSFPSSSSITNSIVYARGLSVADVDSDGTPDVLAASISGLAWYRNEQTTTFSTSRLVAAVTSPQAIFAADMNNDGAIDVISASQGTIIAWHLNDGSGDFGSNTIVVTNTAAGASSVFAADLNGDGAIDVLSASTLDDTIAWYRNDGAGVFPDDKLVISNTTDGAKSVFAADLNNDGAVDVLSASPLDNTIAWYRNNGTGGFPSGKLVITDTALGASSVFTVDLNNDGAIDVLSASNTIAWYRNDGTGAFPSGKIVISSVEPMLLTIFAADLNNDRFFDVLFFSQSDFTIAWYRNNGTGGFSSNKNIIINTAFSPHYISAADVNNDGVADVLSVSHSDASVAWYRNNGTGGFPSGKIVISSPVSGALSVLAADIDNDGMLDVLAAATAGAEITWYRSVPFLAASGAVYDASALPLPLECGGVPHSVACIAARITAYSSACTVGRRIDLPPLVGGCFATFPLTVRSNPDSPLTLVGPSTFRCASPSAQALFSLTADSALAVHNVDFVVARSPSDGAGSGPATRSMITLCSSSCNSGESAYLELVNVSLTGFAGRGTASLLSPQTGHGAIAVFGASTCAISGSRFVNNSTPLGGGAISLLGDSARLTIVKSHFEGNRASGAFADGLTGGGAIALLGPNVALDVSDGLFLANSAAAGGGGSIGISAPSARVRLTRVRFVRETVGEGGSGGALAVRASASNADVTIGSCVFDECSVSGAGGALALLGAAQARISLSNVSIVGCSAAYGGALAATIAEASSPALLDVGAMAFMPASSSAGTIGLINASDSLVRISASRAVFGGALFVCGARVDMTRAQLDSATLEASVGGGIGFLCRGAASANWVALASTLGDGTAVGYGPRFASPPERVEVSSDFVTAVQSGVPIGAGSAQLVDAQGNVVRHSAILMRSALFLSGDTYSPFSGGTLTSVLSGDSYAFGSLALAAASWPTSLGSSATLALGVERAGALSSPLALVTVNITGCARGWGRVSGEEASTPLVCAPCTGETTTLTESAALGGVCVACSANSARSAPNGTSDPGRCLCVRGFYAPSGLVDATCEPCPIGASCAGGLAAPLAAPGFYPDGGAFVACLNADACLGGGRCARGYVGRLCGQCASEFYALNGRCRACNKAVAALASIGMVLLALAVAAMLLWFNLAHSIRYKFASLSIGLAALQMLALFGRLKLDFGPLAEAVFRVASSLSLNIQLTSPECSVTRDVDAWLLRFWLTMALPVIAGLALVAVAIPIYFLMRHRSLLLAEVADGVRRSWFQSLTLLYLPLIATSLSVFGCRQDAARIWVLLDDPSRVCFDARWWRLLFAPGLIFSALYGVAIPAAIIFALRRARRSLDAGVFYLRYSFAVARFFPSFWYFEGALMVNKLALVLAFVVVADDNGKANVGVMVLVASIVQLTISQPYAQRVQQHVAVIVQCAVALTLLSGVFDNFLFRRVLASIGVLSVLAAIAVGLSLDFWLYCKHDRMAASEWRGEKQGEHAGDDVELGEAKLRRLGGRDARLASFDMAPAELRQASLSDVFAMGTTSANEISTPPPL